MPDSRMSYRQLLEYLQELDKHGDPRLDDNVTVYDAEHGEYMPADIIEMDGDDVLDDGHLFLMIGEVGQV